MRIRFTLDITRAKKSGLPEGFEYVLIDDDGNEQPVTPTRVGFMPNEVDEDED